MDTLLQLLAALALTGGIVAGGYDLGNAFVEHLRDVFWPKVFTFEEHPLFRKKPRVYEG